MAANTYDIGDLVRLHADLKVGGVLTDPTTLTLTVTPPDSDAVIYTYAAADITKSATGQYYYDLSLTKFGQWWYKWVATGTVESAGENYLIVRLSSV